MNSLNSLITYKWKDNKKIYPLDSSQVDNVGYPHLKITTLTNDEDISEIRGTYVITKENKIRCVIYGDQLSNLIKKIKGVGNTMNAKLNYSLRNNYRGDNKNLQQFIQNIKRQFCSDLSSYLVYLKLMKDPKIWSTDTFPFPFKLPIPEVGSDCLNYKVYVQVQCIAKVTVIAGENLPGTHWMKDIASFWDDWSNCFSKDADPNDRILLEAECEAIVGMASYLNQKVNKSISESQSLMLHRSPIEGRLNLPETSYSQPELQQTVNTKRLERRIDKLEADNRELRAENNDLRSENQEIKAELDAIKLSIKEIERKMPTGGIVWYGVSK